MAALRVREVPRRRRPALHAHEVGRRGDGDRAHVQAGVREGDALARARRAGGARRRPARRAWRPRAPTASTSCWRPSGAARPRPRCTRARRSTRGSCASCASWRSSPRRPERGRAHLPRGRHLRGRVRGRDAVLLLRLGAARRRPATRSPRGRPAERDDPRLGPEPDRPGDRVRLLLRARRDDRARVRPRRGDGQLQPGDGLDGLRHLRPALLRAAHARGRARHRRGRAARGRDRPVRRPDAAQARGGPRGGRACRCSAPRRRRSTSPRTAAASARCSTGSGSRRRRTPRRAAPRRRWRPRPASASRCSCGRATCSAAARWSSSTRPTRSPTTCARTGANGGREIFLDRFLENAIEVDVDAICDGEDVWIGGIMQHVEEAGIHSGDSACVLPPHSLGTRHAAGDPRGDRGASRWSSAWSG